jgi:hypothetical protein
MRTDKTARIITGGEAENESLLGIFLYRKYQVYLSANADTKTRSTIPNPVICSAIE